MSGNDYVTYGGIKFRQNDVKNFETVKVNDYQRTHEYYVVTLKNGAKVSSEKLYVEANALSGASVFLNTDESVTLHNLMFTDVTGAAGKQDVFRITGAESMRNKINLNNGSGIVENDRIIIEEEHYKGWFAKVNRVNLKEGDKVDYGNDIFYTYEENNR